MYVLTSGEIWETSNGLNTSSLLRSAPEIGPVAKQPSLSNGPGITHFCLFLNSGFQFPARPQNSNKPITSSYGNQGLPHLLILQRRLSRTPLGCSFYCRIQPSCGLVSSAFFLVAVPVTNKLLLISSAHCQVLCVWPSPQL